MKNNESKNSKSNNSKPNSKNRRSTGGFSASAPKKDRKRPYAKGEKKNKGERNAYADRNKNEQSFQSKGNKRKSPYGAPSADTSSKKRQFKKKQNSRGRQFDGKQGRKRNNDERKSTSLCPVSHLCGACQNIDVAYPDQLARKTTFMTNLFEGIAEEATVMDPIAGMETPFHYRNKVVSPYAPGKKIKQPKGAQAPKRRHEPLSYDVLCGMYAQGSHRIIPTDSCLLENTDAKQIVLTIKDLIFKYGIEAYREDEGTGFLRHAVVRVGHNSDEILVTLVTNEQKFPGAKNFTRELVKSCPKITTVVQNINTRQTNVILGEKEQTLYGPGFILDTLCGLSFRISSRSFYQVNATQTEVLYQNAIAYAQLTGTETVLDAYCGTGTIGLVAAKGIEKANIGHAARVIGVDNVASAIVDARNNAIHNGIENAEFYAADAGEFMTKLAESNQHIDVLLMDPPRAGSSEEFLSATIALAPSRIVYISCNPKTQVRDVEILKRGGYSLERIQAVDMFPHTEHVESIALLTKKGNSGTKQG